MNDRDPRRVFGGVALVALLAALATHAYEVRAADARVLAIRTTDATRLADVEETSARQSIELQGEIAACHLDLEHTRASARDDVTVDATVVEATGPAPVALGGPACRVELAWSSDPLEGCRVLVACGTVAVYGGPGSGHLDDCTIDGRGLVRAADPNPTSDGGDPRLTVNREDGTLTVSDSMPGRPDWSVRMTLPAR